MRPGSSNDNQLGTCDFCRRGRVVSTDELLEFGRQTDRGFIWCEVLVSIGRCERCGFAHVGPQADAAIENAVKQVYERLPPRANR